MDNNPNITIGIHNVTGLELGAPFRFTHYPDGGEPVECWSRTIRFRGPSRDQCVTVYSSARRAVMFPFEFDAHNM